MRWEQWLVILPLRLRSLLSRADVERELDEELRFHYEQRIDLEISFGKTAEQARHMALQAMEGLELQKERCRDTRKVNMIENLKQDVAYSWRSLWNSPGFTVLAVLTLALGMGQTRRFLASSMQLSFAR